MMYAVNRNKWGKLSIFEQMGNIGSEVGRAFNAKTSHRNDDCQQATIRALDLFDATVEAQIGQSPARAREILRAREQFLSGIYAQNTDEMFLKKLDGYFLHFAIAARLKATT